MQDNEFVFKVPRVRKRWLSLYCTESISELDDVWVTSEPRDKNSTNKSIFYGPEKSKSQSYNYQQLMIDTTDVHQETSSSNDIAMKNTPSKDMTVENNFYLQQDSMVTMNEDDDECNNVSQSKYTTALLNELTLNSSNSDLISEGLKNNYQSGSDDLCKTIGSPCWQNSQNSSNQLSCYEEILNQESSNASKNECNFYFRCSSNVLIVQDESVANADSPLSTLDWDSLTPPAARSPCDHTVPDLDDLNSVAPSSDFLLFAGPFLMSQMEGQNTSDSSQSEVDWDSLAQPSVRSQQDQIIPDLDDLSTLAHSSDFLLYSGPFLT